MAQSGPANRPVVPAETPMETATVIRPRMTYQRLFLIPAAFAVLALVSAACGGGSSSSPTATIAASTAAPSPTTAPTTAASPTSAAASAALIKVATTAKGSVLTDSAGFSLYTFDNDKTATASACTGGCASTWPAVTTTAAAPPSGVAGATGAFTLFTRDDGTKQVAYNGKPLYRYTPDKAPGDTNGDGVGGVWHLAKP